MLKVFNKFYYSILKFSIRSLTKLKHIDLKAFKNNCELKVKLKMLCIKLILKVTFENVVCVKLNFIF